MEDGIAKASEVQSEERINAWEQFHEILYKEYRHLLPNASSETVLSVSYATRPDPQILEQDGPELSISLDRARDLVASLPESARQALLAPIHLGLLDLQSVFYLKDNTSMNNIAICVEDYLQLIAARYANWQ
uniref:Uncharacterized protein n=1 Tax=Plectus sambesii TaxID=2011161 RepID=A0A914W9Y6_9BILA